MTAWNPTREKRAKRAKLSLWHRFVLLVGYATLLLALARGVVYVIALAEGVVKL